MVPLVVEEVARFDSLVYITDSGLCVQAILSNIIFDSEHSSSDVHLNGRAYLLFEVTLSDSYEEACFTDTAVSKKNRLVDSVLLRLLCCERWCALLGDDFFWRLLVSGKRALFQIVVMFRRAPPMTTSRLSVLAKNRLLV